MQEKKKEKNKKTRKETKIVNEEKNEKRDKILNFVFGILYYVLGTIFFFYLYVFELLVGRINVFSSILFYIIYLIVPIILLLIPIILNYTLKNKFYKSILYSCIVVLIHIFLIIGITLGIERYFNTFSKEKWCNDNWHSFRYLMINDLEEKYNIIGMTKNEVYDILGKEDYKQEKYEGEYVISYSIRSGFLEGENYQINLNENDIVTKVETLHWD